MTVAAYTICDITKDLIIYYFTVYVKFLIFHIFMIDWILINLLSYMS